MLAFIRALGGTASVLMACLTASIATAQPFPNKPVRLVVPFAPGTGSDLLARQVAPRWAELLGQAIVIENRPGAGGTVATAAVARTAPDGYTLLLGTVAQFVIAPAVYDGKLKYRPDTDFVSIGTLARSPMILVTGVGDKAPRSAAELVQRIRSEPANFSSTGTGSFGHLVSEMFAHRVGARSATHIPYKGSAQSLADVSTGEILFAMDSPAAAVGLIRNGRLRPLAVTGTERIASMKDVPTLEESGIKDMNLFAWFGVFTPAGTPPEALQRLRTDLETSVMEEGFRQRLALLELDPFRASATKLDELIRQDIPHWRQFIRDSKVEVGE